MEERTELVNVNVEDPTAMARWAHGFCRGQSVEHLASLYGVEPSMDAVLAKLGRYLPEEARQIVAKACEEELRRSESDSASS